MSPTAPPPAIRSTLPGRAFVRVGPQVLVLVLVMLSACSTVAPEPAGTAPGTPATGVAALPAVAAAAVGVGSATSFAGFTPVSSAASAASAPGRIALAAMTPAAAPPPPPFATVIKDARRIDGPLTLWQRDEKVWIELLPEQFGRAYMLSPKLKNGIGEGMILGGLMGWSVNGVGGPQIVEFVRLHNQVRLQARNTDVLAKAGSPEALAVASSYSASLLAATPVASAPHPDRKSVLIDASSIFVERDLMGMGAMFQRGLRQGYSLDRNNSMISAVRGTPQVITIETQMHFTGGSSPVLPTLLQSQGGGSVTPHYLPDARSMLIGLHYSLAQLPETPMPTRRADPRVGLFNSTVLNFSDDLLPSPRQRHINRWRLEKRDPAADLSEPVKPIAFWIDRNVPMAYRETVRAAILEWNKAFEKIGFLHALTVQQQGDDDTSETLDFGHASVRWMANAEPSFNAIGPSHHDPRTGEILDATIAFEGIATRGARSLRAQVLPPGGSAALGVDAVTELLPRPPADPDSLARLQRCQFGELAAEQLSYALDVMDARGELAPDSPMAQQFVQDFVKDAIMHEVGHVLGLRHNFRASRAYSEAQLADPEFTRAHGTTGSVMEYNAVNLPLPGHTGGSAFQNTLGPYDYWAIEYAYKTLPPGTSPEAEAAELQRVAARSNEPLLAFGTDEDTFFGLDPETIQLDLGNDPIAFASKRLAIAKDLFARQEQRALSPQRDYTVLRRSLAFALGDVTRALGVLARQIGGVATLRDFPGSGRDPLQPVPAAVQREAMDLMVQAVLAPDGLQITPALQRRLAPDFLERAEGLGIGTDFALPQRLLDLQRAVLAYLMSDNLAARVLDSGAKVDRGQAAFEIAEIYQRLSDEVWRELPALRHGSSIPAPRRELQRDYINRLAMGLVRPTGRTDARSYSRVQARALLARLESAQQPPARQASRAASVDAQTRAHLADAIDTLRQSLAASIQRQAL